jgi:hypothetical protein
MPAPSCCIPTARSKAPTIRAPMAVPMACKFRVTVWQQRDSRASNPP